MCTQTLPLDYKAGPSLSGPKRVLTPVPDPVPLAVPVLATTAFVTEDTHEHFFDRSDNGAPRTPTAF